MFELQKTIPPKLLRTGSSLIITVNQPAKHRQIIRFMLALHMHKLTVSGNILMVGAAATALTLKGSASHWELAFLKESAHLRVQQVVLHLAA